MRNLKLTLRYDGTDFNGWQTQPGLRTVQETLEQAIAGHHGHAAVCQRQRPDRRRAFTPSARSSTSRRDAA